LFGVKKLAHGQELVVDEKRSDTAVLMTDATIATVDSYALTGVC